MTDPSRLYDEADALKEEGKYDAAIEKLLALLDQDEKFALAHSAMAVLCEKVGQHEKAVEHAKRVCQLEPDDPFSFTALSVTYQRAFVATQDQQYIQLAEEAMARSRMMSSTPR